MRANRQAIEKAMDGDRALHALSRIESTINEAERHLARFENSDRAHDWLAGLRRVLQEAHDAIYPLAKAAYDEAVGAGESKGGTE